jgi:hypothetical protein
MSLAHAPVAETASTANRAIFFMEDSFGWFGPRVPRAAGVHY